MSDSEFSWQDCTSRNDAAYRCKATEYDIVEASADEVDASGPPFRSADVNWAVGSEGAPTRDIQDITAIIWYKFSKAPSDSPYQYQLTIAARDTYRYNFSTNEDSYDLIVSQDGGTHMLEFNSSSPTINRIAGA